MARSPDQTIGRLSNQKMKTIYFDNNATSAVAPEVVDAMMPYFKDLYGNPSSMHFFGGQIGKVVENAREQVAQFLNCWPDEIIFTSCASESDNSAIFASASIYGKDMKMITSAVEHPAVLQPARRLKAYGHKEVEVGVDSKGIIDLEQLRAELAGTKNALVSVMWANNETGVVTPVEEVAQIAKEHGAVFHTDAVQAAGKIPLDMQKVPADFLSISGHKFHAPKGIGVLFARRGAKFRPYLAGGHQESARRAGTENVPYIVGLAKACELAMKNMDAENIRLAAMRDRLEAGLLAACPDTIVNGDPSRRLPNTLNLSFCYIEGEAIVYHLSDLGICVSTGSACASGSLDPSHVIRAMGVPFIALHGSTRFSLSRYNTDAEIDYAIAEIPKVIKHLRDLSPFGPGKNVTTYT